MRIMNLCTASRPRILFSEAFGNAFTFFRGMDPYLENPGLWPTCTIRSSQAIGTSWPLNCGPSTLSVSRSGPTWLTSRTPSCRCMCESGTLKWRVERGGKRRESLRKRGGTQLGLAEPVIATTWYEQEIHQAFLKIVDRSSDVVTVIEILSPRTRPLVGAGRRSFEEKRREVMYSPTHWVEIDLLPRAWPLFPFPGARPA